MADKVGKTEKTKEKSQIEGDDGSKQSELSNFVADNYHQQMNDGKMEATEDIDDQRRENFFARAMKESQRMNAEVHKSYQKMEKLHDELGPEIFNEWRAEHTAEVLTPQERQAVERAHQEINN